MANCVHYEVNVTAASFGDCKCGQPKAAHSKEALTSPAPVIAAPKPVEAAPYYGPCDKFLVNMNAAEFGTCNCGFKKGDHGKPRELFMNEADVQKLKAQKVPMPPPQPKDETPEPVVLPATLVPAKPTSPCHQYTVDVNGAKFGNCKCGFSKEEHKHAGTYVEPEHKIFAGGHNTEPQRATNVAAKKKHPGKQEKACNDYQVDTAGKIFGDCMCGHAKMQHREFNPNLEPEVEAEPEVAPAPKVIVRDGVHPCELFELNLKNQGGFANCLCGFTRLDHEQFSNDPVEWQKVKDSLTAPKEFE